MPLKGEVGGHSLNSHGNYIVDHGKSWKNHGIVFLNFCGNPVLEELDLTASIGIVRPGIIVFGSRIKVFWSAFEYMHG